MKFLIGTFKIAQKSKKTRNLYTHWMGFQPVDDYEYPFRRRANRHRCNRDERPPGYGKCRRWVALAEIGEKGIKTKKIKIKSECDDANLWCSTAGIPSKSLNIQ